MELPCEKTKVDPKKWPFVQAFLDTFGGSSSKGIQFVTVDYLIHVNTYLYAFWGMIAKDV